ITVPLKDFGRRLKLVARSWSSCTTLFNRWAEEGRIVSTWLVPRNKLTPEQMRAVELRLHEHRVILGAPGSGKTQILLHRARYLCDAFHVAEDRFHIFVFTNLLKDYIGSALHLLNLPSDCVTTLDHWCSEFYKGHI